MILPFRVSASLPSALTSPSSSLLASTHVRRSDLRGQEEGVEDVEEEERYTTKKGGQKVNGEDMKGKATWTELKQSVRS